MEPSLTFLTDLILHVPSYYLHFPARLCDLAFSSLSCWITPSVSPPSNRSWWTGRWRRKGLVCIHIVCAHLWRQLMEIWVLWYIIRQLCTCKLWFEGTDDPQNVISSVFSFLVTLTTILHPGFRVREKNLSWPQPYLHQQSNAPRLFHLSFSKLSLPQKNKWKPSNFTPKRCLCLCASNIILTLYYAGRCSQA